ncbi:MAG: hypothetical protein GF310_03765, partial [candidate division Zixibacteria bacterium]|nr:hypothetical protein [candidate division Zixibacteria bacterium]
MRLFFLTLVSFLLSHHAAVNAADYDTPEKLMEAYTKAVENQDWKIAEECWHRDEIEKSNRLGINYKNTPAKFDCSSPLITLSPEISEGWIQVELGESEIGSDFAKTDVYLMTGDDSISVRYYMIKDNEHWYLISPMTALASDWHTKQSRYTNIICSDESMVNDYAVEALDNYIEFITGYFEIDSLKQNRLHQSKINYYLCTRNDFMDMTGYDAHGLAYLSMDAIVTRHLPHPHELTHLLINYALDSVPLYTLPLVQEGLACVCGGRWGKSPEVINQLGSVILENGFCRLDDILTQYSFNIKVGMPDITYPVSSLFVGFLIDRIGMPEFEELYLALSGSSEYVRTLSKEKVVSIMENYCDSDFESVKAEFLEYAGQFKDGGILVKANQSNSHLIQSIESDSVGVNISESEGSYDFLIKASGDSFSGVILFSDDSGDLPEDYRSWMFEEHLPEGEYDGACYGVKYDMNECGFYDYRTNTLKAKFVSTFFPQKVYFDTVNKTVRFSLKKSLLPESI